VKVLVTLTNSMVGQYVVIPNATDSNNDPILCAVQLVNGSQFTLSAPGYDLYAGTPYPVTFMFAVFGQQ
jgi:hypothetical protein